SPAVLVWNFPHSNGWLRDQLSYANGRLGRGSGQSCPAEHAFARPTGSEWGAAWKSLFRGRPSSICSDWIVGHSLAGTTAWCVVGGNDSEQCFGIGGDFSVFVAAKVWETGTLGSLALWNQAGMARVASIGSANHRSRWSFKRILS